MYDVTKQTWKGKKSNSIQSSTFWVAAFQNEFGFNVSPDISSDITFIILECGKSNATVGFQCAN